MVLSCQNITKSFITDVVLNQVNFQVNDFEKVALVGINGAGKSTLFKIITREMEQDSGEVVMSSGATLGYLAQNAIIDSECSIYDEILHAREEILQMELDLRSLEKEIALQADDPDAFEQLSGKYALLQHRFEEVDGYSYRSRVKGVIKGLGFGEEEFEKKVNILSGGQKTRLALAKILISQPDLLLLDEPTNHLDVAAVEWLEGYLSAYKGALIIISHDRYFLDRVATKVVNLENGRAKSYMGNYSFFSHHKDIDREIEEKHYVSQQREIKEQEEAIKLLKSFNREKSVRRARSKEKQLDKVERLDKPLNIQDTMKIQLSPKLESGQDVLMVKNLKKSFGHHLLFENLDFELFKGERVALIGGNGTGKSTIFKILTHSLPPSGGTVVLGTNVNVGYYDQEHALLVPTNNLINEISDTYPDMKIGEIRNLLAAFLFTGDDVFKPISALSGGEKGRLTLAKLMLSKANCLLLDEPTNHLDLISKEVLENALNHYTGTLFFISHDRYFINQIATRILELTPTGVISYTGNYDYYIEKRDAAKSLAVQMAVASGTSTDTGVKQNKEVWLQKKENDAKRRKRERQIEKTETDIHHIESRLETIDGLLCQEEVYTDHIRAGELTDEKNQLDNELIDLYEQWELLHMEE